MGRPATGRQVTKSWIEIFRLESGKAVGGWLQTDMQRLLEQVS
jgi:predicted ester cyclase